MIRNKTITRLILVVILCIFGYANTYAEDSSDIVTYYKVALDTERTLNIRQYPSGEADVVGKVHGNITVNVISQTEDGEWFEIKHGDIHGYVKSEYIKKYERKASFFDNVSRIFSMTSEFVPKWSHPLKKWMTIGLLILATIIIFIHKYLEIDSEIHVILTSVLSVAVIIYVLYMGANSLWFLNFSKSGGWMGFIINILAFFYFVFIQLCSFAYTKIALPVRLTFGITSIVLFFAGLIACTFIGPKYAPWVFGVFILSQIIQCVLIYKNGFIWYAIAYLLIATATVMLLLPALVVAIIIAIAMLMLVYIYKSDAKTEREIDMRCQELPKPEEPEYDIKIKGGGTFGEDLKAKTGMFGDAIDEHGRKWIDNKDGTYTKA